MPGHVYYVDCVTDNRAYQREYAEKHRTPEQRLCREVYAQRPALVQGYAGPQIGCCGQWHPINHMPLQVPCCGTIYFQVLPTRDGGAQT